MCGFFVSAMKTYRIITCDPCTNATEKTLCIDNVFRNFAEIREFIQSPQNTQGFDVYTMLYKIFASIPEARIEIEKHKHIEKRGKNLRIVQINFHDPHKKDVRVLNTEETETLFRRLVQFVEAYACEDATIRVFPKGQHGLTRGATRGSTLDSIAHMFNLPNWETLVEAIPAEYYQMYMDLFNQDDVLTSYKNDLHTPPQEKNEIHG